MPELQFCVDRGAPVNAVPPGCLDSALHFAAYWGKLQAVEFLAALPQTDLFLKDEAGDTALEVNVLVLLLLLLRARQRQTLLSIVALCSLFCFLLFDREVSVGRTESL